MEKTIQDMKNNNVNKEDKNEINNHNENFNENEEINQNSIMLSKINHVL